MFFLETSSNDSDLRNTSLNACFLSEDAVNVLGIKVFPFVDNLRIIRPTTMLLCPLRALDVYEVKTVHRDFKNIPLIACYAQGKDALNRVILLIYNNLLSTCRSVEVINRILKVLGKGEEAEKFVSDVLSVVHVSVMCVSVIRTRTVYQIFEF